MKASAIPQMSPGMAVDAAGNVAWDPSRNVETTIASETRRQDDLRDAAKELSDVKHAHEQEIGRLREAYQEKIQHAESGRIDSIRQVDREEVAKTAVAANTAIATLAKQTNDLAVTLAKTVTDTATAAEARNSAQYSDTNKRLSALELSSSEGKGKQTVSDPQLEKLAQAVENLSRLQDRGTGKTEGMGDSGRLLLFVFAILTALMGFYTFTQRGSSAASQPQVIVVPAGTPTPSAVQSGPPTQVTR